MPDVVVIGGGIIGCACAYYLSLKGIKVHLLEKGAIGSGASKAGMCHIVTWEEPEIHLQLELASKALYDLLCMNLPYDIEYRATGSLALVETEAAMQAMSEMVVRLRSRGHSCEMLSLKEMLALEPNLTPDIAGGAFFADDVQVNPMKATLALAQAAQISGSIIEPNSEVVDIELDKNGRVQAVNTMNDRIPAGYVIIAAGAWSGEIGKMAGLQIPIKPRKGHLAVTAPLPDTILNNKTLFSAGYLAAVSGGDDLAVACNIQQTQNGNLLLGSSRQFVGFDQHVDSRVLAEMLKQSIRFFPQLTSANVIRTWTGFRPYTPDVLPIISGVETNPGIYIAAGHEGLGITEGPITGRLISQLIAGETPEIRLDLLAFSRFDKQTR